jgi:hypothetical protein
MFNKCLLIEINGFNRIFYRIRTLAIFGFRFKVRHAPHQLMQIKKLDKNVNKFLN